MILSKLFAENGIKGDNNLVEKVYNKLKELFCHNNKLIFIGFLDRVAGRLFAFEEGGKVVQYVCPFSDYLEARAQREESPAVKKPAEAAPRRERTRELRMSFKEQREFETIDETMEKLQRELERLDAEIEANASDFVKLTELSEKKEETQQALDAAEERWLYLTDLHERIEAQKNG